MKLLTPRQMKAIDEIAINTLGIPGIVLMENAAIQIAFKASSMLEGKEEPNITVIAGSGNNGGDALAVTRHLLTMGYAVSVFSMTDVEELFGDAYTNGRILKNLGVDIPVISGQEDLERLKIACRESDLVIDGLFGTGLNRFVQGIWSDVIDIINTFAQNVLSIDIPSGIDGLSGKVMGNAVKADATVTFYLPKIGMVQQPGASYMGELSVVDIGIPYALSEQMETSQLNEKNDIREMLPIRPVDGHKGTFGKLLVFAGSESMTGAAYLSALSAYRTGSGFVRLAVPRSCINTLSILLPEAVFTVLTEYSGTGLNDLIKKLVDDSDAVLIGPGLSRTHEALNLMKAVIENCDKPMVMDADALNILSKERTLLERLRCETVITPHPVEMSRLTGKSVSDIQGDRINIARNFADEFGLTVVLKGAGTVIVANDGRTSINPTGNQGMATAGSGDVLAGVITSLLGQGLSPYDAAVTGVYLHGLAGDIAAADKGAAGVMATDIAENISKAIIHVQS
ncbi:MAG: NAD(P)H-hydrate dehydratase [Clostridiaceae bacterium]|nr:NAD(P)H-hydrate dehydratase [Clostridiaceae bacterium]